MKLSSPAARTWLFLALTPFFGCAAITTGAFEEAVDGAPADAGEDVVAQDSAAPPVDSGEVYIDSGVEDTHVVQPDTAVTPDTRPDTRPDTTPPTDAPAVDNLVQCSASPAGGTTCGGGQHCCITTNASGSRSYACQSGTCTGVDLGCDDTASCAGSPGTVCCGTLNMAGMGTTSLVTASSCQAAAQCTTANNRIVLCNPSLPNVCPMGRTCRQSTGTLPGYYLCL